MFPKNAQDGPELPPEGPYPGPAKQKMLRSPGRSAHSMRISYYLWANKLARYNRVSVQCVDEQACEAMRMRAEKRAA